MSKCPPLDLRRTCHVLLIVHGQDDSPQIGRVEAHPKCLTGRDLYDTACLGNTALGHLKFATLDVES